MKDIRAALRSILLADTAVSAAIGGVRIYPSTLPQGVTLPSLVQNLISEDMGYHTQGDDGLMAARIQIDAWALTPDLAVSLADLVFDRLSGYSGTAGYGSNSPQNTMTVRGAFLSQGRESYDSASKMYARQRDYILWYGVR